MTGFLARYWMQLGILAVLAFGIWYIDHRGYQRAKHHYEQAEQRAQARADALARRIEQAHGWKVRVVDLRWLQPLNAAAIVRHAGECARILVVDEGRRSAGVGEGVITAVVEGGHGGKPLRRVVGEDTYTPLAGAAFLVIPSEDDIVAMAAQMAAEKP